MRIWGVELFVIQGNIFHFKDDPSAPLEKIEKLKIGLLGLWRHEVVNTDRLAFADKGVYI
jgi:hypothetical protein